jgi:hypothetical protein
MPDIHVGGKFFKPCHIIFDSGRIMFCKFRNQAIDECDRRGICIFLRKLSNKVVKKTINRYFEIAVNFPDP